MLPPILLPALLLIASAAAFRGDPAFVPLPTLPAHWRAIASTRNVPFSYQLSAAAEDDSEGGQDTPPRAPAKTNTVNTRLAAELEQAMGSKGAQFVPAATQDKSEGGTAPSEPGKLFKMLSTDGKGKTEEQRQKRIDEARDLNGVNPAVAAIGSASALAVGFLIWQATISVSTFFAMHPVDTDIYTLQRLSGLFRTVVVGATALASGFFGVCGLGLAGLAVKVAAGIAAGELDPTPIVKKRTGIEIVRGERAEGDVGVPNILDLMMGKKTKGFGGYYDDDS